MRAVVQRVGHARVEIDGHCVAEIGRGILVLLGIEETDGEEDLTWLLGKVARMRIHADDAGLMNSALQDIGGEVIVVSQFTLHASTKKGNRPSFLRAARPEHAEPLYQRFCDLLEKELGHPIGRGVFGADMKVTLMNDGPVTILIDSKQRE
ncbi:MAG: D-aminoacyl-tRNA deacylase [Akkermansiaceae bacterium]|jgi:D-tyrosyl-tRNA(Tyr) deacylase|nr:D-aminoacyl-tRNA deacylase [Akkermansiaceae bacterium]